MVDLGTTNVLVADDEPSTRAMVARHLRSIGYKVIEAVDGDEAISLALEHLPDIVVLDVMMPGMSGWEVCRRIRETVSLAHTGVVMLTGIGESLNEITSPLYGADAHLDKPFEFSVLDATIAQTLESRRDHVGRLDGADVEIVQTMGEMDDDESDEPVAAPKRARRVVTSGDTSKNEGKRKRAKKPQPETDESVTDVEDYDFSMDDEATDAFETSEVETPSKSKKSAKGKAAKTEKAPKKIRKTENVFALEADDEPDQQHSEVEVAPQAAKRKKAAKPAKAVKQVAKKAVPAKKKTSKQTPAEEPAAKSKPAKAKKQAKVTNKAAPKKKTAKTKPAAKKTPAKAAKTKPTAKKTAARAAEAKKQTKTAKKVTSKKKVAKTKPIVKKSSAKKASPKKASPKRVAPKPVKTGAKGAKKRAKK